MGSPAHRISPRPAWNLPRARGPGGRAALAALLLAACGGEGAARRPPRGDGGWVDPGSPSPTAPRPAAAARWDLEGSLRATRPAVKRGRSGHLTAEVEADVLASGAGAYPRLGPEGRAPEGATLIERIFEPGGAAPVAYFVMVKRAPGFDAAGADWEYLVVTPAGQVEQRGALPLCARCHAEAPHDRLFGGPR